jgi:hypothetical protein
MRLAGGQEKNYAGLACGRENQVHTHRVLHQEFITIQPLHVFGPRRGPFFRLRDVAACETALIFPCCKRAVPLLEPARLP